MNEKELTELYRLLINYTLEKASNKENHNFLINNMPMIMMNVVKDLVNAREKEKEKEKENEANI
jgi:hypothetical protein